MPSWWLPVFALLAGLTSGVAFAQPLLAEPIRPLPAVSAPDPALRARVSLGRALFHDLRLSRDNNQSCASCHALNKGGADTVARALGPGGQPMRYNTPSIYNSIYNYRQGWTGVLSSIDGVLHHVFPPAAGSTVPPWELVAARLTGDAAMSDKFTRAYGEEASAPNVMDALHQYLRSLTTPSRFDRYLRGERQALTADEKAGYARFKSFGCVSCHQGINVGGNMYQKFGAMRAPAPDAPIAADLGRFEHTRRPSDRHLFRVPSLRNVALTAPYLHNGSVATLEEAVDVMFKYQLGRDASAQDKALIVRFLHTLSGEPMPPRGATP